MAMLVEREQELSALDDALAEVGNGRGRVLTVEGEAGLGKTSVLGALRARATGLKVLTARGTELEQEFPFEIVGALLRGLPRDQVVTSAPVRALLGLDGEVGSPVEPSRALLDAIFRVFESLALAGALVICVDDAQWADGASLRALAYISNRLEELPLLLAIGRRTGARSADDAALEAIGARATRLVLAPLSLDGTRALASADLSDDDVAAMHTVTRGNPLLIGHVADDVAREGPAGLSSPRALRATAVAGLVLRRLAHASGLAQAVARSVSVLGDDAPVAQVAALSELTVAQTLTAAAELEADGIFARDEPLSYAHPLLAATVADDAGANALGLAHLRAAEILRADGSPVVQIAGHIMRAPVTGDQQAVADLRAAAAVARSRAAPDTAVTLLRRALLEGPASEDLRVELALAELATGDGASAWSHLEFVVDDPARPAGLVVAASQALSASAGFGAAIEVLLRGAAVRAAADEPDAALQLTAAADYLNWFLPVGERPSVTLPDPDTLRGVTPGERLALAGIVAHRVGPGSTAAHAAELARRALGDGLLLRESRDFAVGPLVGLLYAEDFDAAPRELAHIEPSELADSPGVYVASRFPGVYHLLLRGDVAAAIAEAEALLQVGPDLAGAVGTTAAAIVCTLMIFGVLAHDGPERADTLLARYGYGGELGPDALFVHCARAHVHLAAGRTEQALADALMWRGISVAMGDPVGPLEFHTAEPLALAAAGREAEAIAAAERELDRARTWGASGRIAGLLRCLARIDATRAAVLLEEAGALIATGPMRLERARTLLDLGIVQRREGRRQQARTTLENAVQAADEAQAHVLAEAGLEELRVLGARPRRRAFSGAESLTASERRVAELAAEGKTNRQIAEHLFLTMKTIDSHLMRSYRKLGISSRRDLATALQSSGAPA